MTIQQILSTFQAISLAHVDVVEFNYGEVFDLPNGGTNSYPFVFLEIPYFTTYDDRRSKTVQFALNVVLYTNPDDRVADHQAISDGNSIGEAILTRIQNENKDLFFESITGISLREFSDDDLSGMRYEFTIRTAREYCNPESYEDKFKDC